MTLAEAAGNVGKEVFYSTVPGEAEPGVIARVNSSYVLVRYPWQETPVATCPADLTLMRGGSAEEHFRLELRDSGLPGFEDGEAGER